MIKKINITIISIVIILLILLYGLTKIGYIEYMSITRFIPVVVILFFLIDIALFLLKRRTKIMLLPLLFIILLVITNIISNQIINNEYQKVFKSGVKIGSALDQYYKDNQHYPKDLDELVPKYINKIPKANVIWEHSKSGSNFSYSTLDYGNKYQIKYEAYVYSGKGWYHLP